MIRLIGLDYLFEYKELCVFIYLFVCFLLQVASVMTIWYHMQPAYAANMWNEALNKRLGTEVNGPYVSHSPAVVVIECHLLFSLLYKL